MRYEVSIKELYSRIRSSAQRRGIEFRLTLGDLNNLTFPITCPILGMPLKWNRGMVKDDSYSIDRIDSDRGYEIDNIIVISWKANRLKNNGSVEDMLRISEFYMRLNR